MSQQPDNPKNEPVAERPVSPPPSVVEQTTVAVPKVMLRPTQLIENSDPNMGTVRGDV